MPKMKWDGYHRFCPFAKGLDVVGERWTLVILHYLLGGPARYNSIKAGHPGIGANVLSDRLRKLEAHGVVQRTPGEVGNGVYYELTERGWALAPMMAEMRRWGAVELVSETRQLEFDLSYGVPAELQMSESYEWQVDDLVISLEIEGQTLRQSPGPATKPTIVLKTSVDFMSRWGAGDVNWVDGRASGEVEVEGDDDAWDRMLVATQYPGRPAGLIDDLLASI